jgi:uncharacterized membrane protein
VSERRLRAAIASLATAGAAIAAYLVLVRYTHSSIYCPTSGCETVQASRYSELFGVPVAVLGLGAFLAILATSLSPKRAATEMAAVVALSALAFAVYLLVVQLLVIHAVCVWCLASDAAVLLLALTTSVRLRRLSRAV